MELLRPIILTLLFTTVAVAQSIPGFESKFIRQFPLDEQTVYEIKIAKDEVTTLTFPGPITALEGAGITIDPQQSPATVLLNYQEGRPYFSVRAVADTATASLNVVFKKHTYVLQLHTDKDPFRSVTFYQSSGATDSIPTQGRTPVSPTKLLSLIDRAKVHHLIEAQHPELVSQIETAVPNRRMFYKNFDVVLAEVFRFDVEDALVFKVLFFNNSAEDVYYQPQTLAVRTGNRIFYSALSDASGIMPSGILDNQTMKIHPSISLAYFVITGTPGGSRNNLAANNDFNVIAIQQLMPNPKP